MVISWDLPIENGDFMGFTTNDGDGMGI